MKRIPTIISFIHKNFYNNTYKIIGRYFSENQEFKVLDIGCGNDSAIRFKRQFPCCKYYGLDKQDYNNSPGSYKLMEYFYDIDADLSSFTEIPENYFDIIIMSHVIEHLNHGDRVLNLLLSKIKKHGYIYIEYPGIKSCSLPSGRGKMTLNFFDDSSHCRIYTNIEILNILLKNKFEIIKFGTHRNILKIILSPMAETYNLISKGRIVGGALGDLFGFAEFVFAKKLTD